jgi:aminoglycoside 6'-N-acetyltransferase
MSGSVNPLSPAGRSGQVALLVIDVQQGLFQKPTPIYQAAELLQTITALVARARQRRAPVIYVQHSDQKNLLPGSPAWQLHPQLQPLPPDYLIHKQHGNAFEATDLHAILQSVNVTCLVVAGLVTQGCIRATCLGALQLGYRVILAADGHSTYSRPAAQLIAEWNQKLSALQVELQPAAQVEFGG